MDIALTTVVHPVSRCVYFCVDNGIKRILGSTTKSNTATAHRKCAGKIGLICSVSTMYVRSRLATNPAQNY